MTPRVATEHKIKQDFTPAELAEYERELERKRDLRHAMATTLGERVVEGAEFKQLQPTSASPPHVADDHSDKDVHLASLDAGETKALIRSVRPRAPGRSSPRSPALGAGPCQTPAGARPGAHGRDVERQHYVRPPDAVYAGLSLHRGGDEHHDRYEAGSHAGISISRRSAQTYASLVPVTRRSLSGHRRARP